MIPEDIDLPFAGGEATGKPVAFDLRHGGREMTFTSLPAVSALAALVFIQRKAAMAPGAPSSEPAQLGEMNEPVKAAQWSDREPYYIPRSAREPLCVF